ncbi:MAG: leucine-rich repeat domain-containing protein [Pseudomonadota bacterium]
MPDWIGELRKLISLQVSDNKLPDLPDRIGDLRELEDLDVSHNELRVLPHWIGELRKLEYLNVSGNALSVLPDWIGELRKLKSLDVNDNHLTDLPDRIGDLCALEWLSVSRNHLRVLPDRIGELSTLEDLIVCDNALERLPNNMGYLPENAEVDVSNNPIALLPSNFREWKRFVLQMTAGNLTPEARVEWADINRQGLGPRPNYNMTQAGAAQTVEEDRELGRPLDRAAAAWLSADLPDRAAVLGRLADIDRRYRLQAKKAKLGHSLLKRLAGIDRYRIAANDAKSRSKHVLAGDAYNRVRDYSRMLDRLPQMEEYKNIETCPVVMERTERLLQSVARTELREPKQRDKLHEMRFGKAQHALGACGDRVAEGYGAVLRGEDACIAIMDDWSADKRLGLIESEWLDYEIDLEVFERRKNRGGDFLQIALGYKMRLVHEKGVALSHAPKEIRFEIAAKVSDDELETMAAHLQGLDRVLLDERASEHEVWQDWLRAHHSAACEVIDQGFGALMESLQESWDFKQRQHPGMSEEFAEAKIVTPAEFGKLIALIDSEDMWKDALQQIGQAKERALEKFAAEVAGVERKAKLARERTPAQGQSLAEVAPASLAMAPQSPRQAQPQSKADVLEAVGACREWAEAFGDAQVLKAKAEAAKQAPSVEFVKSIPLLDAKQQQLAGSNRFTFIAPPQMSKERQAALIAKAAAQGLKIEAVVGQLVERFHVHGSAIFTSEPDKAVVVRQGAYLMELPESRVKAQADRTKAEVLARDGDGKTPPNPKAEVRGFQVPEMTDEYKAMLKRDYSAKTELQGPETNKPVRRRSGL